MLLINSVLWKYSLFMHTFLTGSSFSVIFQRWQDSRHGQGQGHDAGESTQSTADLTAFVSLKICKHCFIDALIILLLDS
jgi:hypothetical protein